MQVIVYAKKVKEKDISYIQSLFSALHEHQVSTYVYAPFFKQLDGRIDFKSQIGIFEGYLDLTIKPFDFMITLGGDGTILEAVTHIREKRVPILGINLGRLGFLASIEKKRIDEAISLLIQGRYSIEDRQLLYLESNLPLFGDTKFAMNDFTLLKRDTSAMITVHTYINGAYLTSYWSDGLIVSTPTGSTGYSLSCGGPIIFPGSGNFVITPVAPHNLTVRPVVISDNSVISFEIEGRAETFLATLDSRTETITAAHQLAIRKNDFTAQLVRLDVGFLETIRNKLDWGSDQRNS